MSTSSPIPMKHQQLFHIGNATHAAFPENQSLVDLFEAQVMGTPQAIALVAGNEQLTYQDLDTRTNQLARALQHRGVGPNVLVGLCLPRSLDFIVALLAVLKAGGAYIPLDPAYPPDHLTLLLEDAQPAILLTHSKLGVHLTGTHAAAQCLDLALASFDSFLPTPPARTILPEQLAYVIYTSGSTGRPKGVGCNHSGVINLLTDFERRQPLLKGDRCSLWASVSFDASVYEIFSALLFGQSLYLVPDDIRASGMMFAQWLYTHKINSAYIPPVLLADLAFWSQKRAEVLSLRRLLVGVEPINDQLLTTIQGQIPGLRIINAYGPTETTICATLYTVPFQPPQNKNTPIGKPVQNMQVYLLDHLMHQVLPGETGEMYVGGTGLAQGYLNRPDLTAERFVPHPFSDISGVRLYKTGDLARYLPDGNIEFLGRYDQQVKLRGFRIELGEIESVLRQHPDVQGSAVVLRTDVQDEPCLVGYVVPTPDCTPNSDDLHQFLKGKLPQHMVPATILILDALPLLPNGKLDRRALPVPEPLHSPLDVAFDEPQDSIEELIAGVWATVLHVERVGRHDDFFKLGGQSLTAMQVRSRLSYAFGVEIPFESLFDLSTIANLAVQIKALS